MPSTVPTSSIPDMVGGPLEAGYVLSRTWEIFKIHWGLCLVAALIPGGVQQLVSMVLQVFIGVAAQIDPILAVIILFLAVLIAIPLMVWLNVGQMLFMLRVAQGEAPEIGIMFRGAPWILRMVGLWLLLSLLLNVTLWICIGIPAGVGVALGAALGEPGGGALVGVILGAVVGLIVFAYLTFAFSQAAYLMIDRNVGVMDSLRGSWQITQGNKLAIFLVYLMLMLINLGGLAACCIGVMATMPFSILALAVMYTIMARSSQTQMA
ncbi:MAG: hypothetical protein K8T91_07890 [Planctomycetes bacterium]|nr:hypothetical protein [Planctomycetota bacterium]